MDHDCVVPKAQGLNTTMRKIRMPLNASHSRYNGTSTARSVNNVLILAGDLVAETVPASPGIGMFSLAIGHRLKSMRASYQAEPSDKTTDEAGARSHEVC